MQHQAINKIPTFNPRIVTDPKTAVVKIHMDQQSISRITKRTQQYKALPRQFRPVMEKVGNYVRTTMVPNTFAKEGPGWRPLARRTVNERQQAGFGGRHPILRRTGDLYRELSQKSHPQHIEIIRVGKRARIEIGGSSAKFVQNQLGDRGLNLPSRPMIPGTGHLSLADRDRIEMNRIIKKAIRDQLGRP